MKRKQFVLKNKGMNRDLSISSADASSAYENFNIRITATDHDTLLSVTNERGTKTISLNLSISGSLIGWNVLNNHIVLFTTTGTGQNPDYIYRVDKVGDAYSAVVLFNGSLGFSASAPIESLVHFETEDIQKIYWIDGVNPLRMMNIVADASERAYWDNTFFDANRRINFSASVTIEKENTGNPRPNGVIQYFLTYYNKHGQETGFAWASDLIYLSPVGFGGSADGTNSNKVKLTISNLDTRFTNYRIYSVFRSSYDGSVTAFLVTDDRTSYSQSSVTVIDDASHQTAVDARSILYLGSQPVVFDAIAEKDGTLFLGNIKYTNKGAAFAELESLIHTTMFKDGANFSYGTSWEASDSCIRFVYSDSTNPDIKSIPYNAKANSYTYENQLDGTSSEITTFKGGEKYRFGLVFKDRNGIASETIWIGDKVNPKYPVINEASHIIMRVVVECTIPQSVITRATDAQYGLEYETVQLMIAEASYADRSIKAQGVISPTVFNVWNRYQGRLYASPSWVSRPRNSGIPARHFMSMDNALLPTGEIQCNYWEVGDEPKPYHFIDEYISGGTTTLTYSIPPGYENREEMITYEYLKLAYFISVQRSWFNKRFEGYAIVVQARLNGQTLSALEQFSFNSTDGAALLSFSPIYDEPGKQNSLTLANGIVLIATYCGYALGSGLDKVSLRDYIEKTNTTILNYSNAFSDHLLSTAGSRFETIWGTMGPKEGVTYGWVPSSSSLYQYYDMSSSTTANVLDGTTGVDDDWIYTGDETPQLVPGRNTIGGGERAEAYYRKQFMFIDENVVTLDSPELEYESASFDLNDNYKLRIVGLASVDTCISDSLIDVSHGMTPGRNVINDRFAGVESVRSKAGLLSWPIYQDFGLAQKPNDTTSGYTFPTDIKNATYKDYVKESGNPIVRYWLHMWNHTGAVDAWQDADTIVFDDTHYANIQKKIFANLRYSRMTVYNQDKTYNWDSALNSLRIFNYTDSQYVGIGVADDTKYYDGVVDDVLSLPATQKYPILFSTITSVSEDDIPASDKYMYSASPVPITYSSRPHAVISLPSSASTKYTQTILPHLEGEDSVAIPQRVSGGEHYSGALIPWISKTQSQSLAPYCVDCYTSIYTPGYVGLDYPYFTLTAYSSRNKKATLSTSTSIGFVLGWQKAKSYLSETPFYALLKLEINGHQTSSRIFIDVSGFKVLDSNGNVVSYDDASASTVLLENADFLAYYSGSGLAGIQAQVMTYKSTLSDPTLTNRGVYNIDLSNGRLTDWSGEQYPFTDYDTSESTFNPVLSEYATPVHGTDPYYFIGEIYYDYDANPSTDTRYGGFKEQDIESSRFIVAGPQYKLGLTNVIYGNQGDTYFQRWDGLRTMPLSGKPENGVIDVVSVMLETHINIDGRYDKLRGTRQIASIPTEDFGNINPVYTQKNNFFVGRDLDEDFNLDTYRSNITWTLEKKDAADTDEWMHITLANTLKLDGDKGECSALRKFQNTLFAFQPKSISEILFNSRTQLSTVEGIPVEIGNSGKVDGKRIVSDKYGCSNKWSIANGKSGLFFVDNQNKALCRFDGQAVENLSTKLGFSSWFRSMNSVSKWTPAAFGNFVSYYDKIDSEVYFLKSDTDYPCLVYNELLDSFTSFYSYSQVPMLTDVDNDFVAFKSGSLWKMHDGLYCNFFGSPYSFWSTYRVTPDPFGDKIWTNIEYRADFYRILNASGGMVADEEDLLTPSYYQPNTTFNYFKAWDEYQSTAEITNLQDTSVDYPDVKKKFRIWRLDIPRALVSGTSTTGLDRLRNPWLQFTLKKTDAGTGDNAKDLMQLHDITVDYYE